jgi:inosine-uridine nucleoside N-ribohydrolase
MAKVIFDCDNTMGLPGQEIDDGLTLYYLLGRPDVELVGVTTTFGNGRIDRIYPQTERMLRALQRTDIPVWRGAGQRHSTRGADAPDNKAAQFLTETAAAFPGEITLLATGPLGNIQAAVELDPAFLSHLKQIVCMGGYLGPLRIGWRNLRELNFSYDPEASHAVLSQTDCPIVLMNGHVCLQAAFDRHDLARMSGWKYDVHRVTRNWLWFFGLVFGVPRFYLWDLLPAVYISHPELFDTNVVWVRSTVADLESGSLVTGDEGTGVPIQMPTQILDPDRFKETLFEAWSRVLGPPNPAKPTRTPRPSKN